MNSGERERKVLLIISIHYTRAPSARLLVASQLECLDSVIRKRPTRCFPAPTAEWVALLMKIGLSIVCSVYFACLCRTARVSALTICAQRKQVSLRIDLETRSS
eukprot:IDg19433t1